MVYKYSIAINGYFEILNTAIKWQLWDSCDADLIIQ